MKIAQATVTVDDAGKLEVDGIKIVDAPLVHVSHPERMREEICKDLLEQMHEDEQKAYAEAGTDYLKYSQHEYNKECITGVLLLIKERIKLKNAKA